MLTLHANSTSTITDPWFLHYTSHFTSHHAVILYITQLDCAYLVLLMARLIIVVAVYILQCIMRVRRTKAHRELPHLRAVHMSPAIQRVVREVSVVPLWLQQVCQTVTHMYQYYCYLLLANATVSWLHTEGASVTQTCTTLSASCGLLAQQSSAVL